MACPPNLVGCRRGCLHRRLVCEYRLARATAEATADAVSIGYPTERAEHLNANPLPTFQAWLSGNRTEPAR